MPRLPIPGKRSTTLKDCYDVIVVGSGAGGLLAAIRAADQGLSTLVIEKASRFGGTSATSGGTIWIANHGLNDNGDTRAKALDYLQAVCRGTYRQDRLEAFVDNGRNTLEYLKGIGVGFDAQLGFPDYFSSAPGAVGGRSLFPQEIDGADLGEDFWYLREPPSVFRLFNRYALSLSQAFALSARAPGWRRTLAKIIFRYWTDLKLRRQTRRDRRLTMGTALVGGLLRAARKKGVTLSLKTALTSLTEEGGRITGLRVVRNGQPLTIGARQAVILAAGGFEQSQRLRDAYFPVPTSAFWSLTPKEGNVGDALEAGMAVGAATELLDCAWWSPSMQLPSAADANIEVTHQLFLDHGHPHSLCVNRRGQRFVNESGSYDRFGFAMIEDQKATGANVPCWMIFDAQYRSKYGAGGLMPNVLMPDEKVPPDWWDTYIHRSGTIADLAAKIGIDPAALSVTIETTNRAAETGIDEMFGRGSDEHDRSFGDPSVKPNPCLGAINRAPFYAVRVDLGDLGNKGGLKVGADARVMREDGTSIEGLYAVGNCAGSPFGDAYPGAGATLGAATVFAFIAADDVARRARRN